MKRLNLFVLIIGVTFVFFSCSKENSLAPELNQNEQETSSLKKAEKIPFTGTSDPMFIILDEGTTTVLPNGNVQMMGQVSVWCESAIIEEVSGRSIWCVNSLTYPDGTVKFWGKADIFVGEDCETPDGYDGKWKLSWHGYLNPITGTIEVDANAVGKEGTVKGMTGKWKYTMTFADGFFYATEGYIK